MSPRKKATVKKIPRTFYIPGPLLEQLNKVADETGVSANDITILALRQYLNIAPFAAPAEPPPPADDDVADFD